MLKPQRLGDERGWFMETYRRDTFAAAGIGAAFIQDNHAFSTAVGTLRGLHFQGPPRAQAKLIRALRGAVFDVAVDIRRGSTNFGRWTGAQLSAQGGEQLYVPAGFAHAYCTLEPDTEVAYKCDAYYAPEVEGGLLATDPEIGIEWPIPVDSLIIAERDRALPSLRSFVSPFVFEPGRS